jgi:hypothetical protein
VANPVATDRSLARNPQNTAAHGASCDRFDSPLGASIDPPAAGPFAVDRQVAGAIVAEIPAVENSAGGYPGFCVAARLAAPVSVLFPSSRSFRKIETPIQPANGQRLGRVGDGAAVSPSESFS